MSDANLIKGEQYVRANRGAGSDFSAANAFSAGIAEAGAFMQAKHAEDKAHRKEISAKAAAWGQDLDGSIDASAIPNVYRKDITEFLVGQRNTYWKHANAASKAEVGSDVYQASVAGMNSVNSAVKNLRSQLDAYNTGATAFAAASENNHISGGMPLDELAASERVYSKEMPMLIDGSGDIAFSGEEGFSIGLKDLPKLALKDFKANNAYLELAGKLYQSGNKLDGSLATLYKGNVRNILRGNRETLLHMATDDSIIDGGFGIVDPHSLSTEELTNRMEASMMGALTQVSNDGYAAKHRKEGPNDQGSTPTSGPIKMSEVPALADYDAAIRDAATGTIPRKFVGKEINGKKITQAIFDSSNGDIVLTYKEGKEDVFVTINNARPREFGKFVIENIPFTNTTAGRQNVLDVERWIKAKTTDTSTTGGASRFN